jgi:xylulose-5-phosphate/fructose-6-phosphate phosphoketolase
MQINEKWSATPELIRRMDAWWRCANYLSAGQLYLWDNRC